MTEEATRSKKSAAARNGASTAVGVPPAESAGTVDHAPGNGRRSRSAAATATSTAATKIARIARRLQELDADEASAEHLSGSSRSPSHGRTSRR